MKIVDRVLLGLVALDVTIAIAAFFFPQLWFTVFHGAPYVDPQGLLPRMAANWAAFAVIQIIALRRWKANPEWLLVVAGARWGDMLTDWTYLACASSTTLFAKLALATTSPGNLVAGWFLFKSYRTRAVTNS
jgi:hypothetical protein